MKFLDTFPLHVTRILLSQDVILMTTCEFGAYCKLLFVSWVQNPQCFIKNNDAIICELCKFTADEWEMTKGTVLKKFKNNTEGYLYNEKLLKIYNEVKTESKVTRKEKLMALMANLKYPWQDFWNDYDKKVGSMDRLMPKWIALTDEERELIRKYIPNYKRAKPEKQYRLNPETFLNQRGWEFELIYKKGTAPQQNYDEQSSEAI